MNPASPSSGAYRRDRFLAFLACAVLLLLVLLAGLIVPLLTGLLALSLVHTISERLTWRVAGHRHARGLAAALLGVLLIALGMAAGTAVRLAMHDGAGFHDLLLRMAAIIGSAAAWLPPAIGDLIPQSDALFDLAGKWLSANAAEVGTLSFDVVKLLGYALIGLLLGTLVALSESAALKRLGPVSALLLTQAGALRGKFWAVASAQVRISAVNTALTAIYLFVALPLAGVHLPLSKTLIILTFLAGLLPVVGNLVSNTAITVISLGYSGSVAIASLLFLVGIHKFEYFLNARIVGGHINARAWEILMAMLVLERLFGLSGVVIAPIFYAWFKAEWHRWDSAENVPR